MNWLPKLPPRVARRFAAFATHRDGLVRWYRGSTRFVCGQRRVLKALEEQGATGAADWVEELWHKVQARIDAAEDAQTTAAISSTGLTLLELASEFFAHLDTRVATGRPKRMSRVTAWDYQRVINAFGAVVGPQRPISSLTPDDFARYAGTIANDAATSYNRKIAYVSAFISWAMRRGRFADNRFVRQAPPGVDPLRSLMGPDLVKLSQQDLRDERLGKEKSFTPAEIAKLWQVADDTERCWIGLGLNAAFDNADIMHFLRSVLDAKGVIDFRRRKRGRVRRVVPLVPELRELLTAYKRPDPSPGTDPDLFFLKPDGQPLAEMTASGPQNCVTRRFTKLMVRAGLRAKPTLVRDPASGRRRQLSRGSGDGRNFRSLRTTFANLAPAGMREEVEIVMGHAHGEVILDSYLERHGLDRLEELVNAVWTRAFSEPPDAEWLAAHPRRSDQPVRARTTIPGTSRRAVPTAAA